MKKIAFILLFFISIFSVNSQGRGLFFSFIENNNIPIIIDDNFIKVSSNIEINDYFEFINLLFLNVEVILENIANRNTTRTENGVPYNRKFIRIIDNEIMVLENINDEFPRLVYNPSHPDAILTGTRKGYVQYPNVDYVLEIVDFIYSMHLLNEIIKIGHNIQIIDNNTYNELISKVINYGNIMLKITNNEELLNFNKWLTEYLNELYN
jgi:hypothetical protein